MGVEAELQQIDGKGGGVEQVSAENFNKQSCNPDPAILASTSLLTMKNCLPSSPLHPIPSAPFSLCIPTNHEKHCLI